MQAVILLSLQQSSVLVLSSAATVLVFVIGTSPDAALNFDFKEEKNSL